MTVEAYCKSVENRKRLQQESLGSMRIADDNTPLVDLKASGLDLVFGPLVRPTDPCWVREALIVKLQRICKYLSYENQKLVICAGWRSAEQQQSVRQRMLDEAIASQPGTPTNAQREILASFVAAETESMHLTGGAIDALIFDSETNQVLNFGSNDGFTIEISEACYPYHPDTNAAARYNRNLLINAFEQEDFVVAITKFWHFDYGNANWAVARGKSEAIYGITSAQ